MTSLDVIGPPEQGRKVKSFTLLTLFGVTVVALFLWVAFALIVADGPQARFYSIPSSSMQPALMPGDYVTVHFFTNDGERRQFDEGKSSPMRRRQTNSQRTSSVSSDCPETRSRWSTARCS